jgi:hypothetical protein
MGYADELYRVPLFTHTPSAFTVLASKTTLVQTSRHQPYIRITLFLLLLPLIVLLFDDVCSYTYELRLPNSLSRSRLWRGLLGHSRSLSYV